MSKADEAHQRHIWKTRCPQLLARAEAAEARLATLTAALERVLPWEKYDPDYADAAMIREHDEDYAFAAAALQEGKP